MIALPAIDLRGGACVQLVGGDYDREAVRVRSWSKRGASRHGVPRAPRGGLDAATGR